MGIVLTVLEPPHRPEPNLVAALPPGIGRVIDLEPRLVSPRYDALLVTTRGLVVRDHVSGVFSGVPWANFSLDAHLRQHSRHAVLLLWLNERRPSEVAITRRLALNIAAVAPTLKRHPTIPVDDIVLADPPPSVVDLRDRAGIEAPVPQPADRTPGLPPPAPTRTVGDRGVENLAPPTGGRRRAPRLLVGVSVLALAGAIGGLASIVINADNSSADGAVPTISSEAIEIDQVGP